MSSTNQTSSSTASNNPSFDPFPVCLGAFTAVAWAFAIELNINIYTSFKRRRGLYFWSLLVCSWGIILHALGFLLRFPGFANVFLCNVIITIGWWSMITGQALVLYSRLHLVVKRQDILRGVLIMIIWNAITLHLPTTVLTFGSTTPGPDYTIFNNGFAIMERIQMTVFCLQEFLISSIYVWGTVRLLKPVYRQRTRNVMLQLIWINGIIIGMDIILLIMEYIGNYWIEALLKPAVYAIKLKLEFVVLNQLVRLSNSSQNTALLSATEPQPPGRRFSQPGGGRRRPNQEALSYFKRLFPTRTACVDEIQKPSPGAERQGSDSSLATTLGRPGRGPMPSPPIKAEVTGAVRTSIAPPRNGIAVTTEVTAQRAEKSPVGIRRPSSPAMTPMSRSLKDIEAMPDHDVEAGSPPPAWLR